MRRSAVIVALQAKYSIPRALPEPCGLGWLQYVVHQGRPSQTRSRVRNTREDRLACQLRASRNIAQFSSYVVREANGDSFPKSHLGTQLNAKLCFAELRLL